MIRRRFLHNCAATGVTGMALGVGLLTPGLAIAEKLDPFQATTVDEVLKAMGVGSPKKSDQIKITAPKVAENGASVPVVITSMLRDTTEIIAIVAKNPKPLAARSRFGKGAIPSVSTRIKMGETTDLIALVRSEDGLYMAKTKVKVTVGGCGG